MTNIVVKCYKNQVVKLQRTKGSKPNTKKTTNLQIHIRKLVAIRSRVFSFVSLQL